MNLNKLIHSPRLQAAASASASEQQPMRVVNLPRTTTEPQNITPAAAISEDQAQWIEQRLLAQEDSTRHLHNRLHSLEETVSQLSDAISQLKKPSSPPVFQDDDHFFTPESTSFVRRNLSNSAALSSPLKKTAHDFLGKVRTGELTLDNISRDFTVSGKLKPEEAIRATLPDKVVDIVGITSSPYEDSVSKCQRKLEFLGTQEELIKESSVTTMGLGSVDEILDATEEGETCHGLNKLLLEAQTPNEVLEVISDTILAVEKGLSPSPLCPLNLETAIYRIARLMDETSMSKFKRSHFARRNKMCKLVSMAMKALDELSAQSISNMEWALPKIGGESRYGPEMVKVRSKIGNFDVG